MLRAHLARRHLLAYVLVILGFVWRGPCVSLSHVMGDQAVGEQDTAVEMPSLDTSSYHDPEPESTTTVGAAISSVPRERHQNAEDRICWQGDNELQGSCKALFDGHSAKIPDGSIGLDAVAGETRATVKIKEMEELSLARTHYPASADSIKEPVHPEPFDSPESAASRIPTDGRAEAHRTDPEPQEKDAEGLERTQHEGPSAKNSGREHPRVPPRPPLKPAAHESPPYENLVLDARDPTTRPASERESDSVASRDRHPPGWGQDHPAGRLADAGVAAKVLPKRRLISGRHEKVTRGEGVAAGSGLEDFASESAWIPSGEEPVCHWSDDLTGLDPPGPSPGSAEAPEAVSMASSMGEEDDEYAHSEEKSLSWRSQAIAAAVCVVLLSLAYARGEAEGPRAVR